MGTVKVDVDKTAIRHDTIHPYTEVGIDRLLRDIHRLETEETLGGDINATIIRCDLEAALQSNCLTPRQRQAVSLYYFCMMSEYECARLIGINRRNVGRRVKQAVYNLAQHMQGEYEPRHQVVNDKDFVADKGEWLKLWMNGVLRNVDEWWDFGALIDYVYDDINAVLGMPKLDADETARDDEEYPFTSDEWRLRPKREVLMPRPYRRPLAVTHTQKHYAETMVGNDDMGMDEALYESEYKWFYVRYPNDIKVKRIGRFWTERN